MTAPGTIKVFKIGGNVVDSPEALSKFVADFATVKGPKILVHGGGKEATRLSQKMGVETKMVDGRRITDSDTINIVTMVYAGLINKRIVAMLQAADVDAIGLTGADADVIRAVKRAPNPIDFGFVGDISTEDVNISFIQQLLEQNIVPVFCAIMHDGRGLLLNCNADSVASAIAVACSALSSTELIYCFEKDGVLADIDDPLSVLPLITPSAYPALKEQAVISKGMIPKIDNALAAVARGVKSVTIKNSADITLDKGTKIAND